MNRHVVIPGPEAIIWWGVHVPVLAAAFGILGVLLGHWMAPAAVTPLSLQRQAAVVAAGLLLSVGITIATGQRPLIVFGWSVGIGFSGITIFRSLARQAAAAARNVGGNLIEQVADRLGRGKRDNGASQ